jgi:class 3 adenylate cyclase/pimeloyl-ACP methyl ester carboxylesterase
VTPDRPDVRYTSTADGVSLAWWSIGSGPPIVVTHNYAMTHAELEWELPSIRDFLLGLAEHHTVIRYDQRAGGISDAADDLTLEAMCLDLDAVAEAAGLDTFALVGVSTMSMVATAYAASRPERVSALILGDPDLHFADGKHAKVTNASVVLTETTDADFAMSLLVPTWVGPDEVETTRRIASAIYERNLDFVRKILTWDATDRLADVQAPTLVIASPDSIAGDMAHARKYAAGIPDARLVLLPGTIAPYYCDRDKALGTIREHLGSDAPAALSSRPSALRTIVFTDVVDSTALVNRIGDDRARTLTRRVEEIVIREAGSRDGRVVKHLGDGSMIVFTSPSAAADFAIEVQSAMTGEDLALRIGMAVGEPIEEDGDLHGAVVSLAARVAAEAGPGQVMVTDGTRQLLIGKSYSFTPAGVREVKGFDEPIAVYELARG